MRKSIGFILIAIFSMQVILISCGKDNGNNGKQGQEQEVKDALAGTKWEAPDAGSEMRYLQFLEGGRAKISFSGKTKTYDGIYELKGNDITFSIGFEILAYMNGLTHSITYSYKTGTLNGNTIRAKGIIVSDTAMNGQEFSDNYTKVE